jgi:hypothetical protein
VSEIESIDGEMEIFCVQKRIARRLLSSSWRDLNLHLFMFSTADAPRRSRPGRLREPRDLGELLDFTVGAFRRNRAVAVPTSFQSDAGSSSRTASKPQHSLKRSAFVVVSLKLRRTRFVSLFGVAAPRVAKGEAWWARQDSNLQPDRYERPALTIELQAPANA